MEFPSIAIEDLDMSKITITLKKNQDVKQKVKYAYINYSDFGYKSFGITLPTIDIYTYGYLPQEFIEKEDDKKKLKIPIDDESIVAKFQEFENYITTPSIKKHLNINKYNLKSPVIKIFDEDKPARLNLHIFHTSHMITKVFDGSDETKDPVVLPINSIDEFRDVVCYKSKVKFIITPNLWIGNDNTYGVKFMIQAVSIIEMNTTKNTSNANLKFNFGNSTNIIKSNNDELKSNSNDESKNKKQNKPVKIESDDSDNDSNDSDNSNEIQFKTPKTRIINSDDESDAEEIKPKKPLAKAKSKNK
jgi:hypothetical protein